MTEKKKISPKVPIVWGEKQQSAFETIIEKLTTAPVLAYADYSKAFILHTDASISGLGAVLLQRQDDGTERPIAYASRSLKPSERNYHSSRLEFLALKWAVTEKFHDYLYGAKFEVLTDNNPLTYVKAMLCARHCSSPYALCPDASDEMDDDDDEPEDLPVDAIETHALKSHDWIKGQDADPTISTVKTCVSLGTRPNQVQMQNYSIEARKYLRNWKHLTLKEAVLFHRTSIRGEPVDQVVLPRSAREIVFKALHDDMGHQGRDRTLSLFKERFYWPGMNANIALWVSRCDRCIRRKVAPTVATG